MTETEQARQMRDMLHERNAKLLFLCGWLRVTADSLPESSAETARRLARECYGLGATPLENVTPPSNREPAETLGNLDSVGDSPSDGFEKELSSESRYADEVPNLYAAARELVIKHQKGSTSFIQRHFRIGFNSASRLIERMEAEGVVSAWDDTTKTRTVLVDA